MIAMLPSVLVNQMHLHNNDNINNKVLMWASYCLRCDCYRCDGDCYGDDGVHLLRHYHLLVLQKLVRLLSTLPLRITIIRRDRRNRKSAIASNRITGDIRPSCQVLEMRECCTYNWKVVQAL
ncbi:MAG: hypothetical protein ACJ719_07000 [Nitrososphaeraceae archaeon]